MPTVWAWPQWVWCTTLSPSPNIPTTRFWMFTGGASVSLKICSRGSFVSHRILWQWPRPPWWCPSSSSSSSMSPPSSTCSSSACAMQRREWGWSTTQSCSSSQSSPIFISTSNLTSRHQREQEKVLQHCNGEREQDHIQRPTFPSRFTTTMSPTEKGFVLLSDIKLEHGEEKCQEKKFEL